ncbi:MAG TPA: hypothetical protein VFP84_40015 [Kofleriaceae bacterium]|nr:hypothetical protein [Kofleriaceae bacterium]
MAVFAVVGGALSLAFAITRPKQFLSWTTLFYQERIESQLLSPNREEVAQRNIGDRYRELLLARAQLLQIVNDPKLDPFPKEKDVEIKIDKLRQAVRFVARGAMAFRIEYTDSDPDRAKEVTEKLTELLRSKEEALRKDQAKFTVQFATELKDKAQKDLVESERDLNEFLAKNPAFVADTNAGNSEGAGIRAEYKQSNAPVAPRPMSTKERQLQRIRARLAAPPDAPVAIQSAPSPERIAAEAVVKDAQREVAAAKKELDDALGRFTEQHPSAIKAKERLDTAQQKLRAAEAAVPAAEEMLRPATAEDRAALEREMKQLEAEIAQQQAKSGTGKPIVETQDSTTQRVVELELKNAALRRAVATQREALARATEGENRATLDVRQKEAEQGGRLSIIDPAFKPVKPSGPGKSIFLAGGMVLFIVLGLSFAIGLAVIDDRVYRRADLDAVGVPVLAVIPPAVVIKDMKSKPVKPRPARAQTKGEVA